MAIILSIETSTKVCSVAIHQNGELLAYAEILIEKSHAEKITILIEQTAKNAKTELKNLDAIAVSQGPGSYTGLRIGSSTAKGLVYALDKPLIAVDTLQSIAYEFQGMGMYVCAMTDARRMEVFSAIYNDQNLTVSPIEAKIIDSNSFAEWLSENKIIFCGDGAMKCKNVIQSPNATFIDGVYPSAKNIGYLATQLFREEKFTNPVTFEPFYLKEFYMPKAKADNLRY